MIQLYQFALSHYCEKIAWALDHKGLVYEKINLLPGAHVFTLKKIARESTVPVLKDGERVIQDSTKILDYLDECYPQNLLTPQDSSQQSMARQWEERLDEDVGPHLRRWGYWHILRENPQDVVNVYLLGQGRLAHKIYPLFFPLIKLAMRQKMDIWKGPAEKSRQILFSVMDELNRLVEQRSFLVGDTFTRADLTACALFYPMVRPREHPLGEHQMQLSSSLNEYDRQWKDSPLFKWVRGIYAGYRGGSIR